LDGELALFIGAQAVVVGSVLMVLRPYRAGRRPLAIYDQLCAYAVLLVVGGVAPGRHGVALWGIGTAAAVGGAGGGLLLDRLPLQGLADRRPAWVHAGSALVCLVSALLGGMLAESLLASLSLDH